MKTYYDFITENNDAFDAYYDYEATVQWFWMCSWFNKWEKFNWSKAFEHFKDPIWRKLAEHALLDYEDFKEVEEDMYDNMGVDFDPFVVNTNYVLFTRDDVIDGILEKKYKIFEDAFAAMDTFIELENIYNEINNYKKLGLQGKIELFDRVIHAEHESGNIFDDVDIEKLRFEFERDMKKMK